MIPCSSEGYTEKRAIQNGYDKGEMESLERIICDFPDYKFRFGQKFAFRPPRTIVIGPSEPFSELLFLHELGHAILKHKDFRMDVTRIKMENSAWEEAKKLALKYKIKVDEEIIQSELDTYRDWLHKKSRCPDCGLTRFQTPDGQYHCPRCSEFRLKTIKK